jgi:surfactin family lipopeptide synthetase A
MRKLASTFGLFSEQKLALLAAILGETDTRSQQRVRIVRRENPDEYPLSCEQRRMWFLNRFEGGNHYNENLSVSLKGKMEVAVLRRVLEEIVSRHEAMRSTIFLLDRHLVQQVLPSQAINMPVIDLRALPEPSRQAEADRIALEEASKPFDLATGPLWRLTLLCLADDNFALLITAHHIAMDGWSWGVFLNEFGVLYEAFRADRPSPLPPAAIQYADYAAWQMEWLESDAAAQQLNFWIRHLGGAPQLLELPADRPRPPIQTFRGARHSLLLPHALVSQINDFSSQEGVTLFMTLLAAFQTLIGRYTGKENFVVGSPVANRTHPEVEGLIGFFVNSLGLRADLSGDPPFRELLQRVRGGTLDAFANQDLPFERIVDALHLDRTQSYPPMFQVLFVLQNTPKTIFEVPDLSVSWFAIDNNSSKFDLSLNVRETAEGLSFTFEYNTDLFDADRIWRMSGHLRSLLEGIVRDAGQRLSELPLLTEVERRQLADWNDTAAEYPRDVPLAQLVEEQVERTPDAVAVVFEHSSITYRGLNERANLLANELGKRGAGPDQLVGVCLERSVDMVAALLAITKAGAAYVPLDPSLPARRLAYMIDDSGMEILLTQRELRSSLSAFAGTIIEVDSGDWQSNSSENVIVKVTPEHLAYVIYTSGSTGEPKGVQITRRALTNFLWSMKEWLRPEAGQATLAATTISFDIAGLEIWLPLLVGGHVVVVSREAAGNGEELAAVMKHRDVRLAQATPVTWQLLLSSGWAGKFDLVAICGGEAMPREVAAKLCPRVGRLWNFYGPTETTIWSTGFPVENGDGPILIGRPIANTQCYILDEHRQSVPIGIVGELYIGGDGLARGYLNRPELTEEKFIPNAIVPCTRMYRTGDLARYRRDGNIECQGRTDDQVKIRGCRIELGEIESVLEGHPGVRQSVVVAREDRRGDKRLIAFVIPSGTTAPDRIELRALLKQKLPDYMVPSDYVVLDSIPVTPNGKVDRLALRAPETSDFLDSGSVPPADEFERLICEAWADVLGVKRVGIRDNFFDLGGHSLLAVQLMLRLQEIIPGEPLPLRAVLEAPTVEEFAVWLRNFKSDRRQFLVRLRPGASERPPFFCVHGAGGNVLSMRPLAMALPSDLPFYCLQAKGLDGSEPFESVEETAHCYVDEIRSVQPHGPYYIGGGCYGGLVAFEMARKLEASGETVAALVLIDSFNPAFKKFLTKRNQFFRIARFYIRRMPWHVRRILSKRPCEWFAYIADCLKALRKGSQSYSVVVANFEAHMTEAFSDTTLRENLKRVIRANLLASYKFVPKPYRGNAFIFRASDSAPSPYDDHRLGWASVARGGIECFEIEGDHVSMFEEPAVRLLAEKLNAKLLESSARTGEVFASLAD